MKNGTGDYKIHCFQFVDGNDRNRKLRIIYKGSSRKAIRNWMHELAFEDPVVVTVDEIIQKGMQIPTSMMRSSLPFTSFLRDTILLIHDGWSDNGIANEYLEQNSSTPKDILQEFFYVALGDKKWNRIQRAMGVYHQRIKLNFFMLEEIRLWLDSLPEDQYNEMVCRISFNKGI